MNMRYRLLLTTLLTVLVCWQGNVSVSIAKGDMIHVQIKVNGVLKTTTNATMLGSTPLLPFSPIDSKLGIALLDGGNSSQAAAVRGDKKAILHYASDSLDTDAGTLHMDAPIQSRGNSPGITPSVLVPLDFYQKAFGIAYTWDPVQHIVDFQTDADYKVVRVSDFGAVGDGVTDDTSAVLAAFDASVAEGGHAVLLFDRNKTYDLSEVEDRWHFFKLKKMSNYSIEGNGATLLTTNTSDLLQIMDSTNVSIRDLYYDYSQLPYMQGTVVAVNARDRTFDVQMDTDPAQGYATPPVSATDILNPLDTTTNIQLDIAPYGPEQGMIFSEDGSKRATIYVQPGRLGPHFFKATSLTLLDGTTYRYVMSGPNGNQLKGMQAGQHITYGLYNTLKRIKEQRGVALDPDDHLPIAGINVIDSSNVRLDGVTLYSAMGKGIYLRGNEQVTLKQVRIMKKPGTGRLLSTISDGIHAQRNRGPIIIDGSYVESTGDDAVALISNNYSSVLHVVDNHTLQLKLQGARVGDEYMFYNPGARKFLGTATVQRIDNLEAHDPPTVDIRDEDTDDWTTATLAFDHDIPGIVTGPFMYPTGANTWAINLSQAGNGSSITNSTIKSVMRRSLVYKGIGATIENNVMDGSQGGATGINIPVTGDNISIEGNTVTGFLTSGIEVNSGFSDNVNNVKLLNNITVENNTVDMNNLFDNTIDSYGVILNNVNHYQFSGNRITMPPGKSDLATKITNSTVGP